MSVGEQLAIIKDPGYGLRDRDKPFLWFTVRGLDGEAFMSFFGEDANTVLISGAVFNVPALNNRACVVRRDRGVVHFVRFLD